MTRIKDDIVSSHGRFKAQQNTNSQLSCTIVCTNMLTHNTWSPHIQCLAKPSQNFEIFDSINNVKNLVIGHYKL